jgi:hypothetical protein
LTFNKSGKYYLNRVTLFQIITILQRNGFVAPVCNDKIKLLKANLDYQAY